MVSAEKMLCCLPSFSVDPFSTLLYSRDSVCVCCWWPWSLALSFFRLILCVQQCWGVSTGHAKDAPDLSLYRGLTDESEILKFLQHGTLVGLLPVPHPILIRKYQANSGTAMWFRTYMWGVIYLR